MVLKSALDYMIDIMYILLLRLSNVYPCLYLNCTVILQTLAMPRSTDASVVMGRDYHQVTQARILIVGAGGIGCELGK